MQLTQRNAMQISSGNPGASHISVLLRGEAEPIRAGIEKWSATRIAFYTLVIFAGAGPFGAAMGWWRDPMNGVFVAIKFPLIILLTALGNALLNAMLAPLLGLNITLRQSIMAVFMSFAVTAAILGAFAPLFAFLVWNAPAMTPDVKSTPAYGFIKLTCVAMIAFAGVVGNLRLFQLLAQLGGSRAVARRVLFAWLAVNLFLGSQLSWIARPFIGAPGLPVAFLRDQAFRGNFYENVFVTIMEFLRSH
jgi:hypothetical protein